MSASLKPDFSRTGDPLRKPGAVFRKSEPQPTLVFEDDIAICGVCGQEVANGSHTPSCPVGLMENYIRPAQ